MSEIKVQIDNEQYDKAIESLNRIEGICLSDTSSQVKMKFNLYKGYSLYFLKDYSNAIPYLKEAERYMRFSFNSGDCNYLETLYDIASCYKKTDDFMNAEKYYRKAIITDEVQSFDCNIIKQVYSDLIDLYKHKGKAALADACIRKLEQYNQRLLSLKISKGNWQEQVEELFDDLPSFENMSLENKAIVDETMSSILNIINSNVGKNNDDYILYCHLYAMCAQYKFNDTIAAINLNWQLIEIGRVMTKHKPEIATAYTDYLRLIAAQNNVDLIKVILPEAVEYYNATTNKNRGEENLYDIVGFGLWTAGNSEDAIKYFEMSWNGAVVHSINALGCLSEYYSKSDPSMALTYLYQLEDKLINSGVDSSDATKYSIFQAIMAINAQLGNYSEALFYGDKVKPLLYVENDNDELARFLNLYGTLCGRNHDLTNALKVFDRIDTIYNILSVELKLDYLASKGFTYLICDEYNQAIEFLNQAISLILHNDGEGNPEVGIIYHNLGRAYMMQKKYDIALRYLYKSKNLQMANNGSVIENTIKYINECELKK